MIQGRRGVIAALARRQAQREGPGIWLGLLIAVLLLIQTGTPAPGVVLCLILVTAALLVALRWPAGYLALAVLVIVGVILRFDIQGRAFSDVLTVTRAAIDVMLSAGNPYGQGYAVSTPPGAPFAYGPLALVWYLPVRAEPQKLELLVSLVMLLVLAVRGRVVGLGVYAALPPLIVTAVDGSNDTSAGLVLLIALLIAVRAPRVGAAALGVAAAFKPYALAWLVPLAAYGGIGVLLPFALGTVLTWGPALLIWGADNVLWSLRRADAIHRVPYYALAYALEPHIHVPEPVYAALRFPAGGLVAVGTLFLARSSRGLILGGVAIFLVTLYLGWWSTFAYIAAIAPILCWHLDDWLGLPRVVWPTDPVGALTRSVDRQWPVLRPPADATHDSGVAAGPRTIPT